jgi:hypothetical protein
MNSYVMATQNFLDLGTTEVAALQMVAGHGLQGPCRPLRSLTDDPINR